MDFAEAQAQWLRDSKKALDNLRNCAKGQKCNDVRFMSVCCDLYNRSQMLSYQEDVELTKGA